MQRVFVGNFDLEHALAGVSRPRAAVINSDLNAAWLAITEPGDAIVDFTDPDAEFAEELARVGRQLPATPGPDAALIPWGWTNSLAEEGRRRGWRVDAPDETAVAAANSRRFSHELERDFGCGLALADAVTTVDAFHEAVARLQPSRTGWIAKAEFSMSGREAIRGNGAATAQQAGWVQNRLDETGTVFVEPRMTVHSEAGLQFEIGASGDVKHLGTTGLLSFGNGQFAGCRVVAREPERWLPAEEQAYRAAEAVAELGYYGPLGIDAALYESGSDLQLRPIQDINARFTMGRLALGWTDLTEDGAHVAWLFVPWSRDGSPRAFCERAAGLTGSAVRVVRTSPFHVGERAVRIGMLLLISRSETDLDAGVEAVLALCQVRPSG